MTVGESPTNTGSVNARMRRKYRITYTIFESGEVLIVLVELRWQIIVQNKGNVTVVRFWRRISF